MQAAGVQLMWASWSVAAAAGPLRRLAARRGIHLPALSDVAPHVAVFAVPRTLHGWRVPGWAARSAAVCSPARGRCPRPPSIRVTRSSSAPRERQTHRVRWSTPSQPSQQRWTRSAPWWTPSPESAFSQAPSSRSCPLLRRRPRAPSCPVPGENGRSGQAGAPGHHLPHPASHPGRPGRRRALHRAGLQRLCPGHGGPPRAHDRLWSGRGLRCLRPDRGGPSRRRLSTGQGLLSPRPAPAATSRNAAARVTVSADAGGQLLVEAPSMYDRYLHESATEGGPRRVATGDLGRIADGRVVMHGRAKDMVLRRAENIYPGLYEPSLHVPGVRLAVLVGVPSADGDEQRLSPSSSLNLARIPRTSVTSCVRHWTRWGQRRPTRCSSTWSCSLAGPRSRTGRPHPRCVPAPRLPPRQKHARVRDGGRHDFALEIPSRQPRPPGRPRRPGLPGSQGRQRRKRCPVPVVVADAEVGGGGTPGRNVALAARGPKLPDGCAPLRRRRWGRPVQRRDVRLLLSSCPRCSCWLRRRGRWVECWCLCSARTPPPGGPRRRAPGRSSWTRSPGRLRRAHPVHVRQRSGHRVRHSAGGVRSAVPVPRRASRSADPVGPAGRHGQPGRRPGGGPARGAGLAVVLLATVTTIGLANGLLEGLPDARCRGHGADSGGQHVRPGVPVLAAAVARCASPPEPGGPLQQPGPSVSSWSLQPEPSTHGSSRMPAARSTGR